MRFHTIHNFIHCLHRKKPYYIWRENEVAEANALFIEAVRQVEDNPLPGSAKKFLDESFEFFSNLPIEEVRNVGCGYRLQQGITLRSPLIFTGNDLFKNWLGFKVENEEVIIWKVIALSEKSFVTWLEQALKFLLIERKNARILLTKLRSITHDLRTMMLACHSQHRKHAFADLPMRIIRHHIILAVFQNQVNYDLNSMLVEFDLLSFGYQFGPYCPENNRTWLHRFLSTLDLQTDLAMLQVIMQRVRVYYDNDKPGDAYDFLAKLFERNSSYYPAFLNLATAKQVPALTIIVSEMNQAATTLPITFIKDILQTTHLLELWSEKNFADEFYRKARSTIYELLLNYYKATTGMRTTLFVLADVITCLDCQKIQLPFIQTLCYDQPKLKMVLIKWYLTKLIYDSKFNYLHALITNNVSLALQVVRSNAQQLPSDLARFIYLELIKENLQLPHNLVPEVTAWEPFYRMHQSLQLQMKRTVLSDLVSWCHHFLDAGEQFADCVEQNVEINNICEQLLAPPEDEILIQFYNVTNTTQLDVMVVILERFVKNELPERLFAFAAIFFLFSHLSLKIQLMRSDEHYTKTTVFMQHLLWIQKVEQYQALWYIVALLPFQFESMLLITEIWDVLFNFIMNHPQKIGVDIMIFNGITEQRKFKQSRSRRFEGLVEEKMLRLNQQISDLILTEELPTARRALNFARAFWSLFDAPEKKSTALMQFDRLSEGVPLSFLPNPAMMRL